MLDQMKVFNEFIQPAVIETIDQLVAKFNAASAGAIQLTTQGYSGDFFQESFFASLASARRRVDRYGTNSDVASTNLSQAQLNRVKVAGAFGPVLFEPSQLTWLQKPTAEGVEVISRFMAEAVVQDQLNTAVAALVAALENQAGATYDASVLSPVAGISYHAINSSHALFGDRSPALVAEVMTGSVAHKLIGQNLTNTQRLFQSGGVTVIDILGKAVVITDAPALLENASPNDKEKVLSLATGAAIVSDGGEMITNISTTNGKERIETTLQSDYSFMLGLKGYAWDTTNGGKSPTDAELATGSNWDKVTTSIKDTAGVIAVGDATAS